MIRAIGIDISKWDTYYTPKQPVDFVIQRLSYGLMKDERIAELTPPTLAAPVKGAYHYYSSGSPWQSQMDFFLGLAVDKYDFLALDVEKGYNSGSSAFVLGVPLALAYLAEQSKKPVVLYVNPDTWGTWLLPVQNQLLKFDIWLAQYYFVRTASNPTVPKSMTQGWKFWQWSDIGPGAAYGVGSKSLDLNVFNGTVADLQAWAHPVAWKVCPTCGGSGKVPA
jgi:GH25 family lysozyme M1 (1,4-beta-N-acetylmuramidase)